jgi:hypothetical protein
VGKLSKHQLLFEDLATALAQIGRLESARELAEAFWLAPLLPPTAKQQPQNSEPFGNTASQRLQNLDAKVLENDVIPPEESAPPPPTGGMLLPVNALPELGDLPLPIQIWLEDPPLLEQPLSLLRALAPLQTLPVASLRLRLDEAATVEQTVRQPMLRRSNRQRQLPVLQPVLRPLLEARFELLLIVDGGVTMWVWERLVTELQRLFNSGAVFRGVKVIPIAFDEGGAPQLPRLLASSLVAERTLLLLLSDCQGSHWWNGEMSLHLRRWSTRLPLAVLQVLPRHLWRLTALGGKDPLRLTNSRAAHPSERYLSPPQTKSSRPSRFRRAAPAFTGPVVPVISCDATSLGHWSAVVMGDPRSSVAGFRLPAPGEAVKPPHEDPEAQWRQFCNFASPQAHKLAGLLAAAPVITLPVMRLVKKALMPQTLAQSDNTPMPIAEVLSGLLQPIPAQESGLLGKLPHEHVQFEFKPDLQSRFREQISAEDTIAVVKAVSTLLERRLNRVAPGQDFRALLTDPSVLPPLGLEGVEAFATLTADRIESLGGVYAEYAAQLRAGANKAGLPVDVNLPATEVAAEPVASDHEKLETIDRRDRGSHDGLETNIIKMDKARNSHYPLKIFLSHTSEFSSYPRDKSYFTHAVEAVEKIGHKCVEMAGFSAQSTPPEVYDANRVKECDVYIGILGMRYGTLTSEGISHTEHEYNTALEQNKKIFVFILDQKSVDTKLPIDALISGQTHKNLEAFKYKVKKNKIVKFFKSPDDLHNLICDALRKLEQVPLDWIWPRSWDFGPYRAERCKGFYGREWLFTKVREWAQDPNAERALLLTAGYGVGKTAFLAKLITDQLSGLPLAAEHFCQGGINDTLSPGRFVTSIAAQLATMLPAYRWLLQAREASDLRKLLDAAAQRPVEAWDQAVVALLHRIPTPETHFLLVVDALDVALGHRPAMGEAVGVTIVDLLARNTSPPSWLRLLASSRNHEDVTTPMKRFTYELSLDEGSEPNLSDLYNYVIVRCQSMHFSNKLSAAGLNASEVANYFIKNGSSNLYVESLLTAFEADLLPLRNIDDLQAVPPEMDHFYRIIFERGFPDIHTYKHTRSILGVMCEAKEPPGLIELAAISGCDLKQLRTSLLPLRTLFVQKDSTTDNKTILSFEHVSLSQWLSDVDEGNETPKAHPYEVDRKQAKEMIRIWALAEAQNGQAHKWSYLARHLTSHLKDNEVPAIISKLLKEFDWIQARLQYTNINTLLDDFLIDGISVDHDPVLTLLQQALKQSKQVLMEEPNQLASQLLGLLDPHSKFKEIQAMCFEAKLRIEFKSKHLN